MASGTTESHSPAAAMGDDAAPTGDAQGEHGEHGEQSKKRRTQSSSARGVANLSVEQLARKRANDREAQRAIRERTKTQIDGLKQRIRDLESQRPYHDLQLVLRDKDAVVAENADMKKRVESVLAILQPMVVRGQGGLNELAAAAERLPPPLPLALHHRDQRYHHDHADHHATLDDIAAAAAAATVTATAATSATATSSATHSPWLYPGDGSLPRTSHASPGPPPMHPDMPFDERLGVDFLLDNSRRRVLDPNLPPPNHPNHLNHLYPPHPPPPSNVSSSRNAQYAPELVAHLTLPRNLSATCQLDVILLDFLQDCQTRAAEGVPTATLVGPFYPNFTSLVFPDARRPDPHPLSKLFTDILRTFPDICGVPEQVAIVFVMYLLMRWQIEPSLENYHRLPHWLTPRPSQLFTSHPAWFDHLPWPRLRDSMIDHHRPFEQFDQFFIPFTTTVSLNWPYEPRDCLLPSSKWTTACLSTSSIPMASSPQTPQPPVGTPGTTGSLSQEEETWLINPAFETHLRDLNNWTLGPSFRATFPHFADTVKIKQGR